MTPEAVQNLIHQQIEQQITDLGFSHYGLVPLERPLSFELYQDWINEGLHGEMQYLADHAPIKENPQRQWPRAQSALVFAMPYYPHPEAQELPLKASRISLYAQGMDYHFWFKQRMQQLCHTLKASLPDEEFIPFTDSTPVLERDLARKAALGWVGKNTCLIHPKKGSLFFIGEIYTSLKIENQLAPLPDFCGTCTRCIDVCPTQALVSPKKMDARKCISYLTIESRQIPAEELRSKIGDWLFGCDLCQTVCPWNQKVFKNQLEVRPMLTLDSDQEAALIEDLRYLLESSGKKLEKDFAGTPMARAGSFGLKRNAMIVIANKGFKELTVQVSAYLDHPKLGPLAKWTLKELIQVT